MGDTRFVPTGTLPRPGPLGRLVRLLFALTQLLWLLPQLIRNVPNIPQAETLPTDPIFWFIILFTLLIMNHVIKLGLGKSWGRRPQILLLLLVGLALVADLILSGRVWAPPLAGLLIFWLILINLPLGIAHLLTALLRTPGCEKGSYNHLLAHLRGQDPTEHFCPGGVDFADKWEAGLKQSLRSHFGPRLS